MKHLAWPVPLACGLGATLAAVSTGVYAQRVADNAVTTAEDAFGATLGNESIGLYSANRVRGFSPVEAGNVRMDGIYFDRQGVVPSALVEGSSIRVGLSALSYPFPAPTGIVDYRLKKVGEQRVLSVLAAANAYGAPALELDARLPLAADRFGIAAGLALAREEYYDGTDARYLRAGLVPRWRPAEHVEIMPFWSLSRGSDEEAAPAILTAGPYRPPRIERRRHFGQDWSDNQYDSRNFGVLAKARFAGHWALAGGMVRSINNRPQAFAELFSETTPAGRTRYRLVADPRQHHASTSGELRLSRAFREGPRLHVLHAAARARRVDSTYGGSAPAIDYGWHTLGEPAPQPRPAVFAFGQRSRDRVEQWTAGLMYEGRWRDVGQWNIALQRSSYRKHVDTPGRAPTSSHDDPWLPSAAVALVLGPRATVYASHTRGLEESGIAPADAANRNQTLPAIRTAQSEAGVRWRLGEALKLVAGAFDVRKPYFATGANHIFGAAGEVRHRGIELSLSGAVGEHWNVVAGAVLMRPRVSGEAVRLGQAGDRPIGQSGQLLRADLEYRPAALPGWSFDVSVTRQGQRVASRDGRNRLPAYTLVDVGARYRFRLGPAPASVRLLLANAGDTFHWDIRGNNSFGLTDGRRLVAQLAVDFEG